MLTFKPNVQSRVLSEKDLGRFVQVEGAMCLVTWAQEDPRKLICLAKLDSGSKRFYHHVYEGEPAITFGEDFVFEPDVSVIGSVAAPTHASGSDVFLEGDEAFLVVCIDNTHDWRIVSLRTGKIVRWHAHQMPVLNKWRLGVPDATGGISWLLSFQ